MQSPLMNFRRLRIEKMILDQFVEGLSIAPRAMNEIRLSLGDLPERFDAGGLVRGF